MMESGLKKQGKDLRKSILESAEFVKHKNNLKKAQLRAMRYGDEITFVNNSRGIELLDHLLGSNGVVIQKASKNSTQGDEVCYIALFGDLKVDVLSCEIEVANSDW